MDIFILNINIFYVNFKSIIILILLFRCPSGKWGDRCEETCECANGAGCHHVTGQCQCEAGFTGEKVCFSYVFFALCYIPHGSGIGNLALRYFVSAEIWRRVLPLLSERNDENME